MRQAVHVSIYIDHQCWAGVAMLFREALAIAGTLHARNADLAASELFRVSLVGPTREPVRSFTGPLLTPDAGLRSPPQADVVIVAPFFSDAERRPISTRLANWITGAYQDGAVLLSAASGVRVLAETGLLDGHEVTGNLSDQGVFAQHYPQIKFSPETPLVIDGRIISAANINPCMDACVYLVSQFYGEAAAHKFARYTNSVAHPTYERLALKNAPWKQHADQRVKQAQEFIERYFKQDISVVDAARRAAMSGRNFSRRFQMAVGMSAQNYIARCRVEYAKDLLAQPRTSILQVALQSGFRSEVTLRRAFHQFFGRTPTEYRATAQVKNG